MKWIRRYNESVTIKATDETIGEIVSSEIKKLGMKSDLNHIDVSGVTNMNELFHNSDFNGDISGWDVGNVIDMRGMFRHSLFNANISIWNVGNVQNMSIMFSHSDFNGDISGWNVGNVRNMSCMFYHSTFNRDISGWDVGNVEDTHNMFLYSSLMGREPWWYVLSPLFGSPHLMWDSLEFRWIDIEGKIIYRERLSKILRRSYNTKWNGKLPKVFGFTYK